MRRAELLRLLGVQPALAELFSKQGVVVRVRSRQSMLEAMGADGLQLVLSGMIAILAHAPGLPDKIVGLLYPGDLIQKRTLMTLPGARAIALGPVEVLRLARPRSGMPAEIVPDALIKPHLEALWTRSASHDIAVAQLPAEQRVAAFFVEVVLRLGRISENRASVVLPMRRSDMASYLALNADTLSRTLTRIRRAGLIELVGRRDVRIPDWKALCSFARIGPTLITLHRAMEPA